MVEQFAHGVIGIEIIAAIGAPRLHAEGLGPAGDILVGADRIIDAGVFGIMVVLEHEDGRRLEDDGKVNGLDGRYLVAIAVARKCERDLAIAVSTVAVHGTPTPRRACAAAPLCADTAT